MVVVALERVIVVELLVEAEVAVGGFDISVVARGVRPSTEEMLANTVQPFTTGPKIMLFLMHPPFGGPTDCPVLPDMLTHRDTVSPSKALTNACSKLPVIFLTG